MITTPYRIYGIEGNEMVAGVPSSTLSSER